MLFCFKVQLFWEGHKNLRNRPYGFDVYLVDFKSIRTIAHIFVAFSEKLNFNKKKFSPNIGRLNYILELDHDEQKI